MASPCRLPPLPPLLPLLALTLLLLPAAAAAPSGRPAAAVALRRGWNLGDTLETTQYNPGVAAPWVFDSVKRAGFDWCRIPVQWGPHTAATAPFAIDRAFMAKVHETVDWALKAGLVAMINTHHEAWLDNATAFEAQLPRLLSIWEQIGKEFAGVPDAALVFEILNEPSNINITQLNAMNAAVLPVIRKANPTRQVHLGGLAKMGSWWVLQVILPTAPAVSNEGRSSPLLVLVPAVSLPWVPACGSLEPPRRGGENAQKTRKNW